MQTSRVTAIMAAGALGLGALALAAGPDDLEHYTIGECPLPTGGLPTFEQEYIDTSRAGGEPILETHPDGTLLWGSHAGTTHVYLNPAAIGEPNTSTFAQNYEGQTYYYYSADNGHTWHFVPRTPIRDQAGNGPSGLPVSGFSDPEFAIDAAGSVFVSEINLANIAVSKSTDAGRSYVLQSLVEITASDRQWMEADTADVLYFVANTLGGGSTSSGRPVTGSTQNGFYKSVDGGVTFAGPQFFVGGQASSDIRVDKTDGAVYQLGTTSGSLKLFKLPNARDETPPTMTVEEHLIAAPYDRNSTIDPTLQIDDAGNLYVTWAGEFEGKQGVWYSYSTDGGETWLEFPMNLVDTDTDPRTNIWSWIDVGDAGAVSITWLKADAELSPPPGDRLSDREQEGGTGPWHVWTAMSHSGLGCTDGEHPGFVVTQATVDAPHVGQICGTGTSCEARLVDRRLGDYFSNTIDEDGRTIIGITDTRKGGAIGLPLMVRQIDGPLLRGLGD